MGNFFDELFNKVFKPSEKSPMRVKENFVINEIDQTDLDSWMESEESERFFALIYKNYHFKRTGINDHPQVHILDSPYANGFAVTYEDPFDMKSFSRLFLAFGRRNLGFCWLSQRTMPPPINVRESRGKQRAVQDVTKHRPALIRL